MFGRSRSEFDGADAGLAGLEPSVQTAEALPFEPIGWISRADAARNRIAAQLASDEILVALPASEVKLPLTLRVKGSPGLEVPSSVAADINSYRQASGLVGDEGGEGEQRLGFVSERRRTLVALTARVDARFEIEELTGGRIDGRVAGRRATHPLCWTVTSGARLVCVAGRLTPKLYPLIDPQHATVESNIGLLETQGR